MEYILHILQIVVGLLIVYFIVSRITGRSERVFNKKLLKYSLILLAAAVLMHMVVNYLMMSEPDVITQTVEQLKVNPEIKRTIGEQTGYTYNSHQVDSIKHYPAIISVTLHGSTADIDLSVNVDSSANIFEVKEYKVERLIEK